MQIARARSKCKETFFMVWPSQQTPPPLSSSSHLSLSLPPSVCIPHSVCVCNISPHGSTGGFIYMRCIWASPAFTSWRKLRPLSRTQTQTHTTREKLITDEEKDNSELPASEKQIQIFSHLLSSSSFLVVLNHQTHIVNVIFVPFFFSFFPPFFENWIMEQGKLE